MMKIIQRTSIETYFKINFENKGEKLWQINMINTTRGLHRDKHTLANH